MPGGVFSGTQSVKLGDWTDVPMARLVSLKGKGLIRITRNDRLNWQVAAEVNPETGEPLVLWESRNPAEPMTDPALLTLPLRNLPDLTLAEPTVEFSDEFPTPGRPVRLTARVTNAGLAPVGTVSYQVHFFDREPLRGVTPFATRFLRGPLPPAPRSRDRRLHARRSRVADVLHRGGRHRRGV